jgi:adenylate cyclase
MSTEEMEKIGEISRRNNQLADINGALLYTHGIFFQVLEGAKDKIDLLYEKIRHDPRHMDILCLKNEDNISEKIFSEWSMKTINLEKNVDVLIRPMRMLLDTIIESYSILKTYTQPSVFNMLNSGINPLSIPPQAVEKIIVFSDIQAFSTVVEKMPIETVVALVNQYFSICTRIINAHGGEVSKFIGDCVMSYFSAQQADQAMAAAVAILTELEQLRQSAEPRSLSRVLYTGIGIAQGVVIQCNMGSESKKDYTLLGDAVNVASRLESLSRDYSYHLIFNENFRKNLSSLWNCVDLGVCYPKGKDEPIQIYSLEMPCTQKQLQGIEINKLIKHHLDAIRYPKCLN